MSIDNNIKEYRKKLKLTQKDLAKKIGKSERMLQKYENGEVTPSINVLYNIAENLGITFFQLITGKQTPDYYDKTTAMMELGNVSEKDFNEYCSNTMDKMNNHIKSPSFKPLIYYKDNILDYWNDVITWYPLSEINGICLDKLESDSINEIAKALELTFNLKIAEIKNHKNKKPTE